MIATPLDVRALDVDAAPAGSERADDLQRTAADASTSRRISESSETRISSESSARAAPDGGRPARYGGLVVGQIVDPRAHFSQATGAEFNVEAHVAHRDRLLDEGRASTMPTGATAAASCCYREPLHCSSDSSSHFATDTRSRRRFREIVAQTAELSISPYSWRITFPMARARGHGISAQRSTISRSTSNKLRVASEMHWSRHTGSTSRSTIMRPNAHCDA